MKGFFITIEGPDGAGKTSVIKKLIPILEKQKINLLVTREPGGIPIAEKIREVILDPKNTEMDERTEALLYAAARRQHLVEKVMPALAKGETVLCDRFVDSSIAYQGYGRQIGAQEVAQINQFATEDCRPDLTLYIDVPAAVGLERIQTKRDEADLNRLDRESLAFHERVQKGYQEISLKEPKRVVNIDGTQSLDEVVVACAEAILERLN